MDAAQVLTLRQLKLIETLSDVRSVQVAASILGITQSSATKSLQKVESVFETRLFHRTSKGLLPTPAGQIVIRHAVSILRTMKQAERETKGHLDGRTGEIRVGAPYGASRMALQKAIVVHSKQHADVVISVKEAASADLLSMLINRELDCLVGRRSRPSDTPGVKFEHLYSEIACICVRPEHPMATQPGIRLQDLTEFSWILPPVEMRLRWQLEESFFDVGGTSPRRFVETVGLQGKHLLMESDMIGIWPFQSIRDDHLSGEISVLDIALPRTISQIGISTVLLQDQPPFVQEFCRSLQDIGRHIERERTEWRVLFSL